MTLLLLLLGCAYGQYITAAMSSGQIYTSADYGTTWLQANAAFADWEKCVMSSNGKVQAAVAPSYGALFTSITYGATWNNMSIPGTMFTSVAVSGDTGQYQTACSSFTRVIYTSSTFGVTWNASAASYANIQDNSISASGQYQAMVSMCYVYISSDYGQTWNLTFGGDRMVFTRVSVSASGQYILLGGATIYLSSDYGQTFNIVLPLFGNWAGLAMSASGQYLVTADTDGSVYRSLNYGAAWSMVPYLNPINFYRGASMSSSGQYQALAVNAGTTQPQTILTSSNYGANWASNNVPKGSWSTVCMN
jgi:hypothetical protein